MPTTHTLTEATPPTQVALLLHAPRTRYALTAAHPVPALLHANEVLIRITHVGLNPIDWKSADYGFGLPTLPAVNGRDLAGVVVALHPDAGTAENAENAEHNDGRFRVGDRVFGPSTQYRDPRTSAFQSYAATQAHCLARVPAGLAPSTACAIGVGAVTAMLALGSSLGVPLGEGAFRTRDVAVGAEGEAPAWGRQDEPGSVFGTIGAAFSNIFRTQGPSKPMAGEWLLIWGASAVTGFFAAQFALLAGMRVIAVADTQRHGERLRAIGIQHIVDRAVPADAIAAIRGLTRGKLRYAIDCVGKATAQHAIAALDTAPVTQTHIVGLTGLPKEAPANVELCVVPIKTFHTNPRVGAGLTRILEDLLARGKLVLPPVEVLDGGLSAINDALDRLRRGEVGGGRLVVRLEAELDAGAETTADIPALRLEGDTAAETAEDSAA